MDASVAVKWFLREVHTDQAQSLLGRDHELLVPDLIWAELGNVLWKRRRSGELTLAAAHEMLHDFGSFPLIVYPTRGLAHAALTIADDVGRAIYDCFYLALAVAERCRLVTADRRFHDAILRGAFAPYILWVEETP